MQRNSQWPDDKDVPGFSATTKNFISKCEGISAQVCECSLNQIQTCKTNAETTESEVPVSCAWLP